MEWIGWICLVIIICYSSYPSKVEKLEIKVKKLERYKDGGSQMSKLISDLVGKKCKIMTDEAELFAGSPEAQCTVIDADDEWIKFTYTDKKKNIKTKILRIDSIDNIELISE